ncbi:unnamed protein product [Nesidiocoris tenuis]|uniref:Uncharacterized protein n=1 Tax=Nesidiocoris tenuis TaxID=355587 RepID=A0A6H5GJQ5_9HEMI|nr:unnamed protein product [Nesidiocoris tenuis]
MFVFPACFTGSKRNIKPSIAWRKTAHCYQGVKAFTYKAGGARFESCRKPESEKILPLPFPLDCFLCFFTRFRVSTVSILVLHGGSCRMKRQIFDYHFHTRSSHLRTVPEEYILEVPDTQKKPVKVPEGTSHRGAQEQEGTQLSCAFTWRRKLQTREGTVGSSGTGQPSTGRAHGPHLERLAARTRVRTGSEESERNAAERCGRERRSCVKHAFGHLAPPQRRRPHGPTPPQNATSRHVNPPTVTCQVSLVDDLGVLDKLDKFLKNSQIFWI